MSRVSVRKLGLALQEIQAKRKLFNEAGEDCSTWSWHNVNVLQNSKTSPSETV
jgi:hypothetical protein